jgi:hypothetical protein
MGDAEPVTEHPLLIQKALFRVPVSTVVIEAVGAERRDVQHVSHIVLKCFLIHTATLYSRPWSVEDVELQIVNWLVYGAMA